MLLLRTLEYYQLVLCEVSRLYVKKCLRKTLEKIKCVWRKYNGEKAFKERPYFVESYVAHLDETSHMSAEFVFRYGPNITDSCFIAFITSKIC